MNTRHDIASANEPSSNVQAPAEARRQIAAFVLAFVLVVFGPALVPSYRWDWLNLLYMAGALYLGLCIAAPGKALAGIPAVKRALASDKPRGLASLWVRGVLLTILLFVIPEFAARTASYHRTLYYEREGDLLFAPIPDQEYMEKVSMTPARSNSLGLRGKEPRGASRLILCLGDSIIYGYGLSDEQAFPKRLDGDLFERSPQFEVLNGGVNAYPMALVHQRFLALWDAGLRPEAVVIGYSFNEGWLGHVVAADEETKRQFETRVQLKNWVRTSGLYNLIMENWAREYYDSIKAKLVPGTHATEADPANDDDSYERTLDVFVDDLRSRGVKPFFLVLAAFNGQHGRFDTDGPLHNRFAAFAEQQGIPYVRSDEVLRDGRDPDADLWPYFLDYAHMNAAGTRELARRLVPWIESGLAAPTAER